MNLDHDAALASGLSLDEIRERELRRFVAVSAAAHVVLFALLSWSPRNPSPVVLPGVVTVELLAASPAVAPRTTPPKPAPPAHKAPVQKKVVLPKEPSKAIPPPTAKPKPPPRARPVQQEYSDVLAQLRAEHREERPEPEVAPERVAQAAAPSTPALAGSAGARVSPEVADWMRRARIHMRRNWVLASGFRTENLETHVVVKLDGGGNLIGDPRITRRSGNPWYDDSVIRALRKANPLPAPPKPGEWPFVFRPEDSY